MATRWKRPSAAGRRLALERKFSANVAHSGGAVSLLTLTPPGQDLLPWGDETRLVSGSVAEGTAEFSRLVEYPYREVWNCTAQARAPRLFEAAQRAADRFVRRQWGGQLPRQIGNVRAEQKRGVWHFHWLLPMGTEVERAWSRCVRRYFEKAWRNELERWSAEERWAMLWAEYAGERVPRGFYGFGFVDRKTGRYGASTAKAARYMGRNAAGYMARNVAGVVGRHYVSARLVRETGVTMRALRACNWLYVRRKLIAAGELDDEWIPALLDGRVESTGARGARGRRSPERPIGPAVAAAAVPPEGGTGAAAAGFGAVRREDAGPGDRRLAAARTRPSSRK